MILIKFSVPECIKNILQLQYFCWYYCFHFWLIARQYCCLFLYLFLNNKQNNNKETTLTEETPYTLLRCVDKTLVMRRDEWSRVYTLCVWYKTMFSIVVRIISFWNCVSRVFFCVCCFCFLIMKIKNVSTSIFIVH